MDQAPSDAEVLRRRLYRPDASPADLASYLRAAEAAGALAAPPPSGDVPAAEPGSSLRPFVVGAACVAAAALIGGLLLARAPSTPDAAPTAADPIETTVQADGSWSIRFTEATLIDGGRRTGSQGTAVADGPDRVRYTIDRGDTVSGIAARFRLCRADVIQAIPYGFSEGALPAGGSLELGHVSGLC